MISRWRRFGVEYRSILPLINIIRRRDNSRVNHRSPGGNECSQPGVPKGTVMGLAVRERRSESRVQPPAEWTTMWSDTVCQTATGFIQTRRRSVSG